MPKQTPFLRSLTFQIVVAMAVGAVLGTLLGPKAAPLGEAGKLLIQAIKIFATPLLFFSILHAVLSTELKGRMAGRMLGVCLINAVVALGIGLALSNFFRVGDRLAPLLSHGEGSGAAPQVQKIEFGKVLANFVPTSVVEPFAQNLAVTVILLALLAGFALRHLKKEKEVSSIVARAEDAVLLGLRLTEVVLGWIVKLIPFAVFAVVAQAVGKAGAEPLHALGAYVAVGILGLALHVLITHHAWLLALGRSIPEFWRAAREPVVYALGANSSLATLPLTLKALDKLKVSRQASTLGACVGTNFNNDGILLYEAMAALMIAQAVGHNMGLGEQLTLAGLSLIAAMGIAGVPEAGVISLAVVLTTVGLPLESLPLLLTVDWIIARGRSGVNVLSDMIVSLAIDGRRGSSRTH